MGWVSDVMRTSRPPRVALLLRGASYTYQDEIIIGAHQQCASAGIDLYCLSGGNVTTTDPRNFIYSLPGPEDVDAAVIVKATMGAHDGDVVVGALLQRLRTFQPASSDRPKRVFAASPSTTRTACGA